MGRKTKPVATRLLLLLLRRLPSGDRILLALDDTPTKRFGPMVQGAGIHHNPTPGPADAKFLYGHIWVTLAWVVRHPLWGTIGLPLRAMLYIRRKDIAGLPEKLGWKFQTKLQQGVALVFWAWEIVVAAGKRLWVVVDGAYAKRPFLKPLRLLGVVVVSRLRKDAALKDLPPKLKKGQRRPRGRPRIYGKKRISLAKRAAAKRGWQTIECVQYGKTVTKKYKTFLATYRPACGMIRVVIVQEPDGCEFFFSTDPEVSARKSWKPSPIGQPSNKSFTTSRRSGRRQAATPLPLGKLSRLSSHPLDAHPRRTVGLEQVQGRPLRSPQLSLGRSWPTPFARRPSQSLAANHPATRIFVAYAPPPPRPKNRRLRPAATQTHTVT